MKTKGLEQIEFKLLNSRGFWELVRPHFQKQFLNREDRNPQQFLSDAESLNVGHLNKNFASVYSLHLAAFLDGNFVGWHVGEQIQAETYYMRNSAVLEEFCGRGIYSKILTEVIRLTSAAGFQILESCHHPNNPAVLIPKLRRGFIITSTELNERFGFLVKLKYFVNPQRKAAFSKQVGLSFNF